MADQRNRFEQLPAELRHEVYSYLGFTAVASEKKLAVGPWSQIVLSSGSGTGSHSRTPKATWRTKPYPG
ncbi:hypothetical protein LTS18_004591, partial [Coniosporium uncinatum]